MIAQVLLLAALVTSPFTIMGLIIWRYQQR
jgi:hypothetical protein